MKLISRNIGYTHATWGNIYYLMKYGKIVGKYMTLEHVLEARKEQDFEKKSWNKCSEPIPQEIDSILLPHYSDGKFYTELRLTNYEILVSDLYDNKKDCRQVKDWLDEHRWGYKYLNLQKQLGLDCCRKYSGILPTKQGYIVVDVNNKEFGTVGTLDEAVSLRNHLREKGELM